MDRRHPRSALEEPLGPAPVGSRQGANSGVVDTGQVLDENPPRIAGCWAQLPPAPDDALADPDAAERPGLRTGEQRFLPEGRGPGERHGTALMGRRDLEAPYRLRPGSSDEP